MSKDYVKDIQSIRQMMERSSKFFTISGWSGALAGLYSLVGAWYVYSQYQFNPTQMMGLHPDGMWRIEILYTALIVLGLSMFTAGFMSFKRASKKSESIWNPTSRRMLLYMAVPLVSGGLFALICIENQLYGLLIPISLMFYGLALFNASFFTYKAIKILGLLQVLLGLLAAWQLPYGLWFWAFGFGVLHLFFGIYLQIKQRP